ncbi:hypothetical protein A0J61_10089, partial [Choanephora cucurbitarum]
MLPWTPDIAQMKSQITSDSYAQSDHTNSVILFQSTPKMKTLAKSDTSYTTGPAISDQHFSTEFFKLKRSLPIGSFNAKDIHNKRTSFTQLLQIQPSNLSNRFKKRHYGNTNQAYSHISECIAITVTEVVPAYNTVYDVTEVLTSYFTRQTVAVLTINDIVVRTTTDTSTFSVLSHSVYTSTYPASYLILKELKTTLTSPSTFVSVYSYLETSNFITTELIAQDYLFDSTLEFTYPVAEDAYRETTDTIYVVDTSYYTTVTKSTISLIPPITSLSIRTKASIVYEPKTYFVTVTVTSSQTTTLPVTREIYSTLTLKNTSTLSIIIPSIITSIQRETTIVPVTIATTLTTTTATTTTALITTTVVSITTAAVPTTITATTTSTVASILVSTTTRVNAVTDTVTNVLTATVTNAITSTVASTVTSISTSLITNTITNTVTSPVTNVLVSLFTDTITNALTSTNTVISTLTDTLTSV